MLRRRRELHGDELWATFPDRRQDIHPQHAWSRSTSTRTFRPSIRILGDAKLALAMLHEALSERLGGEAARSRARGRGADPEQNEPWSGSGCRMLTSDAKPLSPYRVIYDLLQIADVPNTVITHDAGSPREELSAFWKAETPLSYIGWGKTTQLGYGLGLAMGAKLAAPREALHELLGRRGDRHDGHGLRDLRAREHPDHVDLVEQFRDGDGRRRHGSVERRSTTRPTSRGTTPSSPRRWAATASA